MSVQLGGRENGGYESIHAQLHKQNQAYVLAIENYSGSDALKLWYEYICWMDEVFNGTEEDANVLQNMLQTCLATFENEAGYKQDRRLVKIFIKFVSGQKQF